MSHKKIPAPRGGKREGAGRRPEWFKERCAELAGSPKFFKFAESVFNGEDVDPKLTKDGDIVKLEASVGDKVYLWEKLAAYGYGKPAAEIDLTKIAGPIQKMLDENQAMRLIQELNFAKRTGNGHSQEAVVGNGHSKVSPFTAPNPSV